MTARERLAFYTRLIARAAAELAGEDSKYPPAIEPEPEQDYPDCPPDSERTRRADWQYDQEKDDRLTGDF